MSNELMSCKMQLFGSFFPSNKFEITDRNIEIFQTSICSEQNRLGREKFLIKK